MSADQDRADDGEIETETDEKTLEEDVVEIYQTSERGGSIQITLPQESESIGIEPGEAVLVTGREGESQLSVKPASEHI